MTKESAKLNRIAELLTLERRKVAEQLNEQYKRKHELQKELFDRSIPYNRHKEAKEMLDITIDLISDLALEVSVWDKAREVIFNAMED